MSYRLIGSELTEQSRFQRTNDTTNHNTTNQSTQQLFITYSNPISYEIALSSDQIMTSNPNQNKGQRTQKQAITYTRKVKEEPDTNFRYNFNDETSDSDIVDHFDAFLENEDLLVSAFSALSASLVLDRDSIPDFTDFWPIVTQTFDSGNEKLILKACDFFESSIIEFTSQFKPSDDLISSFFELINEASFNVRKHAVMIICLFVITSESNEQLEMLVNNKLYKKFQEVINQRQNDGITSETDFIGFDSAEITHAEISKNDTAKITVKFISEQVNLLRNKEGTRIGRQKCSTLSISARQRGMGRNIS